MDERRTDGVLTVAFDGQVTEREIRAARQVPGGEESEVVLDFYRAREVTLLALRALVEWAAERGGRVRTRGLRKADHLALTWLAGRAPDGEDGAGP